MKKIANKKKYKPQKFISSSIFNDRSEDNDAKGEPLTLANSTLYSLNKMYIS